MPRPGRQLKRSHAVAAVVVAAVVVAGGATAAYVITSRRAVVGPNAGGSTQSAGSTPGVSATPSPTSTATPKPTDPLTGGNVSGNKVIAVKVENIGLARPQVGLSKADITFVEQVEGAQTRLLAVYHSVFPSAVEPVRSARSTDVQLLPLFGKPGLVYSGANSRVQAKIDKASIVPMFNSTRDPRRVAPHNVRIDLARLAATSKAGPARPIGWTFAGDPAPSGGKATSVKVKVGHDTFRFDYSGTRYTVLWNGLKYADGDSGAVTRADNVVVMSVHDHPDGNKDVLGSPSVMSDTVGSGKVTIYRDGVKIGGTWKRASTSGPLRFTDADGHDIALKPGQTWVALKGA